MKVRYALATLVISGGALGLTASAASAVPAASSAPPPPEVVSTGGSTGPAVQAVQVTAAPSGSSLPLTGGDVAGLTVVGVALLGGGSILVRRTRAKETSD